MGVRMGYQISAELWAELLPTVIGLFDRGVNERGRHAPPNLNKAPLDQSKSEARDIGYIL
jgi:hypothetical protein